MSGMRYTEISKRFRDLSRLATARKIQNLMSEFGM
jgi:hypothetical protein